MTRRVVVTGLGLVTPLGIGVEKTWAGLVNGKSGIGPITKFDASGFQTKIAGEILDFRPEDWIEKKEIRRLDPFMKFALAAATMAFEQSGLEVTDENAERIGCIVGSGIGGLQSLEETHLKLLDKGPSRISPFFVPQMIINLAPGQIGIRFGIKGPNWSPVSACATGAQAVGEAFRAIKYGDADAILCGGAEAAITPLGIAGFDAVRALCSDCNDAPHKASRPFDLHRSGFIMSEGSGLLMLEELDHAKKRRATILAEIVGYAANCDSHHITAPSPQGEGSARCMQRALKDAGMVPEQIGYINAHGTSTQFNDVTETQAIKAAFGIHASKVAISSTKSMLGHQLGAAGSTELAICALALARGILPPTVNYETPDPECDLDYIPNQARELKVEVAMSNSFGFGGANVVLILKRFV